MPLLSSIRQTALEQLVAAVRHPDPKIRNLYAEMFWDLQYLYKFGIPRTPPLELTTPFPPQPQPDPLPIDRLRLHEEILVGLVSAFDGDPDPEPSLEAVLRNRSIRLTAAKNLSERLSTAMQQLNKEIAGLEQQLK